MISFSHRVFLEVAANLSFSKAAQVLFVTQPAISKHVKAMEDQYKLPLFERKGNSIILTDAGKKLYEYLLQATEIERKIEYDLSVLSNLSHASGSLRLGASTTIALYILPRILSGFQQKYQHVDVQLVNRNSEYVLNALLTHEVDLGIIEVDNKLTTVSYYPFMSDEVIPVCSSNSPLAGKQLTLKQLQKTPLALRERGSGTLNALLKALAGHHIMPADLSIKIRLGGTEALKNFLLADQCLGFMPRPSITRQLAEGDLVEVPVEGLKITRDFYFIRRKGTEDYGLTSNFIDYALDYQKASKI
ncbi:LysR substrate-binding domain-containing protein [Mucilaginibacter sp. KACC 22063]|uniref:LysR substrate-binding domain-containing protein n=1 Tax=Mucilaginibacter sp. KACC 22063 TaxID=3025666 RepID=UPI002366FA62|nr:LysR substrate-binding domain-containing protein [Mucilaginibacter sp. KACC 22063]WDF56308.1 LysR substrate-binding domain-containing protein [Mucilaginibacter sp. KACC 22063]